MRDSNNLRQRATTKSASQPTTNKDKNANEKNKPKKRYRLKIICLSTFLVILFTLAPLIPFISFKRPIKAHYIKLPNQIEFKGELKENDRLQAAKYIAKGKLNGAETIEFVNDTMYTGIMNGQIVRVDPDGTLHKLVQSGPADSSKCNFLGAHVASNKECGRPVGLRYKPPNYLYYADAFHGIFKINLDTNEKIQVIGSNDKRFKETPLNFANDVDVDSEGNVYFSDSSASRTANEVVELHVEGVADGRLFKFNEKTQELELLMSKLHFANGIQLTPEQDAILVAETAMPLVIKYYLKGPRKGQHEVFANMPGFPDNIRLSEHNTLLVSFAVVRNNILNILDLLGEYPLIRSLVCSALNLPALSFKLPKYGLVVEYDIKGNILRSWHDQTGKVIESVSSATMHNNKLYLGSYNIDYIAVVDY